MISGLWLVTAVVALAIVYFFGQKKTKPNNFPPGPWGLPIIGALPLLGKYPYKGFIKLKPKYGPLVGFDSFGGMRAIAISDYKLLKQVAANPSFAGRPPMQFSADRSGGRPEGIVFTSGAKWQEQKRFALRKLRDFGFGTKSMEAIILDEVEELVERLREEIAGAGTGTGTTTLSTRNLFNSAVINALWTIVAGQRFKQTDPKLTEIFKLFTQDLSSIGVRTTISMMIPAIGRWAPDWISQYSKLVGPVTKIRALIEPYIKEHFESWSPGQPPRDFIDTYINEVEATTDPASSFHRNNPNSLLFTVFDLFMAGGETTATTLTWILLYMAKYEQVQDKLCHEIDTLVGRSRLPTLNDRVSMPYTEAIIHEVMRLKPLFPATMQSTTEDVKLNGYEVPRDTIVFLNLYDSHYDPELWDGDAEEFRPERWVSEGTEGKKFRNRDGFVPFSFGKRACLGERLAKDELFLFMVGLFQVFNVRAKGEIDFDVPSSVIMIPKEHSLVLSARV